MRTEQRRARGFFGALVADPYRKLAALALAVGLWFFINAQITNAHSLWISLVAVGTQRAASEGGDRLAVVLPTDLVVPKRFMDADRPIDRVEVVLSGPRFLIDRIKKEKNPLNLEITKFRTLDDWQTRTSIEFTAADIRGERALQDLDIELRPSRIRLEVQRVDEDRLPLSLEVVDLQEDQLGKRLRRETAGFSPETARILGPASGIEQWKARGGKRLRATIKSVGNERQVSASLELVGGAELGLRLAEIPVLTMQVLPQTRVFELELPIVVDDLALAPEQRGQYQPEARSRIVRILAGGALTSTLVSLSEDSDKRRLPEWAAANLRLHVHIPRLEAGAAYGNEIDVQARLLLLGKLQTNVERTECLLDEPVVVKLRKNP